MSGGAICAICYEDARPTAEDLQSISACGHVFHELCLQQWMEYCPAGRKSTCPVCKQSCTARDVHRLYFQSAGADPTQPQGTPSRKSKRLDADPNEVDNTFFIRKLEGQLAVTKAALQTRNEDLKELDSQARASLQRAERAEAAHADVKRDLVQCKKGMTTTQEELKRCSAERANLQEKVLVMSKDLAVHKLVGDADLGEEEVFRLANVGCGSNKNAVIETLTKSLILRNKSYKELMARCNELGLGESRALRKSEKTIEQLKKLKVRVQELEKALEEKENARLRGLSKHTSTVPPEDVRSAQRPLVSMSCLKGGLNFSTTPLLEGSASLGTQIHDQISNTSGRKVLEEASSFLHPNQDLNANVSAGYDRSRTGLQELTLPNIVKERGQMAFENTVQACSEKVTTIKENKQKTCPSRKRSGHQDISIVEHGATEFDLQTEGEAALRSGNLSWISMARDLLHKIELLNKTAKDAQEHHIVAPGGSVETLSAPFRRMAGLAENRSSVASLFTSVNSFGAFVKQAQSGDLAATPSSSFILSGADGRGGRVTILRPPSLSLGGNGISTTKKVKRQKVSGSSFGNRQGALQIEHFFGRVNT